jgi:hypothetical protein
MLEEECRSTIPPPEKVEALSRIYFEKVHPIFPVINQEAYHNFSPADPGHVLLQQGICLAASKNLIARPHLIIAPSSPPMSCREFGDKLSGTMRISIEMGLVSNKIIIIQALALMSQFSDNPVGEDISSQLCGRAVQHVQSLGLHLKGQHEEHRDRLNTTLLCCIWAIDRMNAAFNGRPVLMHERDLRKDLDLCFEQQDPCFRIFLKVSHKFSERQSVFWVSSRSVKMPRSFKAIRKKGVYLHSRLVSLPDLSVYPKIRKFLNISYQMGY